MGTDCIVVFLRKDGNSYDTIGLIDMPRCSDLFREMQAKGNMGYPTGSSMSLGVGILDYSEAWGEGWMSAKAFYKLMKKHGLEKFVCLKKKCIEDENVIAVYKFDNRGIRWKCNWYPSQQERMQYVTWQPGSAHPQPYPYWGRTKSSKR